MHAHNDADRLRSQFFGFLAAPQLLVEGEGFGHFDLDTDFDPEKVDLPTFPEGMRIGHRAEFFFEAAIKAGDRYEIAGSHLQVVENGHTLGELDFLLRERDGLKVVHVELAYKFYLLDPDVDAPFEYQCIGANRTDSWGEKRSKLFNRQFPLLRNITTLEMLSNLGLDGEKVLQALCMKMQLFLPLGHPFGLIDPAYRSTVSGIWLRKPQLVDDAFEGHLFALPLKTDWFIDPAEPGSDDLFDWVDRTATLYLINDWHGRKATPLLFAKSPAGLYTRIFVVWW